MRPRPPTEIFDLPLMQYKRVDPTNDALAATVTKAFTRDNATPRRRIENIDGEALSQYARLLSISRVVVRTAHLDMMAWFCAGLDAPPAVYFDDRIAPLLTASGVAFAGNWAALGPNSNLDTDAREGVSAILADRADIIEFCDVLCADILSSRHQFLILHDVKDIPTNQLVNNARAAGIAVELIPAHLSFAVCDLNENDVARRSKLTEFIRRYVRSLSSAPEHLRPRIQQDADGRDLIDLLTALFTQSFEAAMTANHRLGAKASPPQLPKADGDLRLQALSLAGALCELLDPKGNPIGVMINQFYRDRAKEIYETLTQSHDAERHLIRDQLLDCYELNWKILHIINSFSHHDLEHNKIVRLAIDPSTKGVIVPWPYKSFNEYVFFYRFQDFRWRNLSKNTTAVPYTRWEIGNQIDHYVRFWQVVALVELLFMVIRRERPNETIRWPDLGCSNGVVANVVRLEECLPDNNMERQ
jgi:hypothetical protein